MKLTTKFVVALIAGIIVVHTASAVFRVRREAALLADDIARDEQVMGHALALAVERTWAESGEQAARSLIEHANARKAQLEIRWTDLDEAAFSGRPPALREASLTGEPSTVLHRAPDAIHTFAIVDLPDGRRGAIEIVHLMNDEVAYVRGSVLSVIVATGALILLHALIAWGLGAHFIGRPIRALVEHVRRIGSGELGARVIVAQKDELGELASEMNHMAEGLSDAKDRAATEAKLRLAAVAQLRHADRLTTVGTMAAGVAHELGTPINVITGYAQMVLEDPSAHAAHESARVIVAQGDRITTIVRQLLDFARRGTVDGPCEENPETDAADVVRASLGMLEAMARKAGVQLAFNSQRTQSAAITSSELQQVLTNIVMNSVQASTPQSTVSVSLQLACGTKPGDHTVDEWVRIDVEDQGRGMTNEIADRVFEPFFTTKDVGEGTGLGLAVTWGIVNDRGGWIDVESETGRGTRFSVWLPKAKTRATS